MALVEIDETELAAHRQVTATMNKLLNNPKTRRQILEAQKALNPELVIPELEATEAVRSDVSKLSEQLAAMQKSMDDDKAEREKQARLSDLQSKWDKGRSALRAQGYTDEGIATIEKFMEERGVADHELAAAAHEKMFPPAEPVRSAGGNRFDLFEPENRSSDQMKALFENPDNPMALDALVNDTLRQVRGR